MVKPKLRGWLHTGIFPVAVVLGVILVATATTQTAQTASAIFAATSVILFGTSALFHRGSWSERIHGLLRRLDHSNIYLIIAGTYTPFAVVAMPADSGRVLLWIVWTGAFVGALFRMFWVGAPRWLYTTLYVVIGWVAVFFLPDLVEGAGLGPVVLIVLGGIFYTLGAVVYGLKRPDPIPEWFGFHEVFHALTIAGFTVHYIAVWVVVHVA